MPKNIKKFDDVSNPKVLNTG